MAFLTVLKNKAFRSLWLSQLFSQVFLNLLFFSLLIRIYEITGSNSAVSLLVFLQTIPNIFIGALAGVFVDRWGRKPVMFLSHFVRVFAVLAFLLSSESVGWLYGLCFFISVVTQFFSPAEAGTIYQVVKDEKLLLTANSLFSITFFASVIIGNVFAGPCLQLLGANWTYIVVAVAFLVASLFTFQLPGNGVIQLHKLTFRGVLGEFMAGLDYLYHTPKVRLGILLLGASQISIGVLGTIAPGFADKVLKMRVSDVSLMIMAPAALGMVLGAVALGQFFGKTKRTRLIKAGFLFAAICLILYSFVDKFYYVPTAVMSILILMLLGGANAFLDVPVNTMIQENTPEDVRSRVYGVVSSVIGTAAVIPIVLSGAIADLIGVRFVMLGMGVILLCAWVLYNRSKYASDPT